MKQGQIDYGKRRVAEIADKWGITYEQAIVVLQSREIYSFWQWVNADEFLGCRPDIEEQP